ncbi:MAG TPA: response regulator [Gemmatimonadaceae bacterium]|nr:response regulator [Gemmatimonadaceae bacterium]
MTAVLYVDDEPTIRRAVQLWLARYGIVVHTAAGVHDAKLAVAEHRLDGVFIDLWLEDGSGLELYDWLRTEHPALARRVAFVSGDTAGATAQRRVAATGCPVLAKPFDLDLLKRTAEQWVRGAGGSFGLDLEHGR